MTEREWFACDGEYPLHRMLDFLEGRASDRKLRLFSCACCRRVWDHLDQGFDRKVVEAAERIVDGLATPEDRDICVRADLNMHHAGTAQKRFLGTIFHGRRSRLPVQITWFVAGTRFRGHPSPTGEAGERVELVAQLALLRDITGNPFRPIAFDLAWRTPTVTLLATGIYEERAFERMPILADALQDAECDSDDILNHLRDPNATHVRGCWALDLVLGKE